MIGHNNENADGLMKPEGSDDLGVRFRYMPLHIGDWMTGTEGLTFEHRGFYIDFLVRLYNRGKPFPDNDRDMADIFRISIRVWKRLKEVLVAAGKILTRNGSLTNERFEKERLKRAEEMRRKSAAAQARWKSSAETSAKLAGNLPEVSLKLSPNSNVDDNKINDLAEILHQSPITVNRKPIKEEKKSPNGDSSSDQLTLVPSDPPKLTASIAAREAFRLYNETAERCDLPVARTLSPARMRALALRVKEAGGLDGFKQAMANLEKSAFLQGRNDKGWRADIGFVCQPSSFLKLLEGGYGNGAHAAPQQAKSNYSWNGSFIGKAY